MITKEEVIYMDIKQLEAFVYTVKYKSFSEAGKKLFLSQPTISAHITALEKELHTKLVKRTTRDFCVTDAGNQLYKYAVSILNLRQKAMDELSDNNKKSLHIGASSVPALYALPEILSAYHNVAPDIIFHTFSSDSLDIVQKVSDGTLDIGLVGTSVPDSPCTFLPFAEDELVLVTPNTPYYQNLKKNQVPFTELLKEPFIIREDNSGTKRETDRFFAKIHLTQESLNIIAYINQPETIRHCIMQGLGISIMSKKMVSYAEFQKELLIFPLGEYKLLRKLYLVYVKDRYLSHVTADFIHFFEKYNFKPELFTAAK